jgi:hypothetical protein
MVMTILDQMDEPFAFWLVRTFLISPEDQTDDTQPLTTTYTFLTGTVILMVIVIVRILISR